MSGPFKVVPRDDKFSAAVANLAREALRASSGGVAYIRLAVADVARLYGASEAEVKAAVVADLRGRGSSVWTNFLAVSNRASVRAYLGIDTAYELSPKGRLAALTS